MYIHEVFAMAIKCNISILNPLFHTQLEMCRRTGIYLKQRWTGVQHCQQGTPSMGKSNQVHEGQDH